MTSLEVLYTPLKTNLSVPLFDSDQLAAWVSESKGTEEQRSGKSFDIRHVIENYPWDITYVRIKQAWMNDFDKKFPQLADFFLNVFPLEPNDIARIIFLPTRSDFEGQGFWHNDSEYGLRIYLENEEVGDFLKMKSTFTPDTVRKPYRINTAFDHYYQSTEYLPRLLEPTQAFYLNNIRGIHANLVKKAGTKRLACIIHVERAVGENLKSLEDLVVNSAREYPEHAIYWSPPL